MSGPQEPDPNQPWSPPPGGEQPEQQAPYTQPQYPSYQPPYPPSAYPQETPGQPAPDYLQAYPATGPFGSQPGQYPPGGYVPGQYGQAGQYGQPGQYGWPSPYGQPGQPGQYGQYGQYPGAPAAPATPATEAKKRSRAVLVWTGSVLGGAIAAAVLILGFWKPGFFVTIKLDVNAAQEGVQRILSDETNGYGAKNVKDVKCNNGQNPTVKKGHTFTCEVSIDGTKKQVTVEFQDNDGTYLVGRPT